MPPPTPHRYRRIPHGGARFPFLTKIELISYQSDMHLPVAHTCGFTLQLPKARATMPPPPLTAAVLVPGGAGEPF